MKSPFSFIVKAYNERRYDNIKNVGGVEFITSVSKEDHTSSNRFAIVVETPVGYTGPIQPGDQLLVHHNVFKYYNDMKGVERSGKSYFKDDLFLLTWISFLCIITEKGGKLIVNTVLSNPWMLKILLSLKEVKNRW